VFSTTRMTAAGILAAEEDLERRVV